ncbi:MAG: M1 family metallopeptidase, partial [Planctomycetota bacterium]
MSPICSACPALLLLLVCVVPTPVVSQTEDGFSRQDRLRGSITPEREWWDLKMYHLSVDFFPDEKKIAGTNVITFEALKDGQRMQVDLQEPLEITRVIYDDKETSFDREGNVYWIDFEEPLQQGSEYEIEVHYGGTPVESRNPPWEGGVSWQEDEKGNPFIATSCQGIGASIWWPCKDHGYDEPDRGMQISVSVPMGLTAVSNGRLTETTEDEEAGRTTYDWLVENPINNYCVNVNIGDYVNFSETFDGEAGALDMDYWVLNHDRERAAVQFKEAPRTIAAFEHWFGPYPFYEDSYKLVQVPYLGMEHQSSVTYGNGFQNGYRGTDLSATGVGMKFDFIIVHETGHEWFGNNISMIDAADMWIHESFTNYSENLFVEYHFSEKEAQDYVIGCRARVGNASPIIGVYNVNKEGSGDMYYKGGNMLHTLRHVIDDTEKWREILRGLNSEFRLRTVGTHEIESYISEQSGIDFSLFFDQYLRDIRIPVLKYSIDGDGVAYWYEDIVDGFSYPANLSVN